MNPHLIELSDNEIRIHGPAGVMAESPGFANTVETPTNFGTIAQQQSRLHPRHTYNQFWSQLSLDSLVISSPMFRHHADLAYSHLAQLLASCKNLNDSAIIAVPSHYSRQQLAILLGIVGQCPLTVVGLVDMALLQIASKENMENNDASFVFIDLQLHQTVLTLCNTQNMQLVRKKVITLPNSGLLSLYDAWANMITDAFIKQCRFDPQHNAETEQFIYNQLQQWLISSQANNEVLLEINYKGTTHQASVKLQDFEQRANAIFTRINTEIASIKDPLTTLYLPSKISTLPGVKSVLPDAIPLEETAIVSNCDNHLSLLTSEADSVAFITSLALPETINEQSTLPLSSPNAQPSIQASSLPSHILVGHTAYALPVGKTFSIGTAGTNCMDIEDLSLPSPLTITHINQGYVLSTVVDNVLLINNIRPVQDMPIKTGDCISFIGSTISLQFIQVQ